jgi:hypothetical protein
LRTSVQDGGLAVGLEPGIGEVGGSEKITVPLKVAFTLFAFVDAVMRPSLSGTASAIAEFVPQNTTAKSPFSSGFLASGLASPAKRWTLPPPKSSVRPMLSPDCVTETAGSATLFSFTPSTNSWHLMEPVQEPVRS